MYPPGPNRRSSRLIVDGEVVVDNDGEHAPQPIPAERLLHRAE